MTDLTPEEDIQVPEETSGEALGEAPSAEKRSSNVMRTIGEWVAIIIGVFILAFVLRTFVFNAYQIPSGSMETTIMTGDMVFSEKVSYYFRQPARGDIITFIDPDDSSRTLIKRVIATAGQTVSLQDGQVYVDGIPLDETYTNGKPSYELQSKVVTSYPYTVPEGEVWVMGDNRTNSQDSRYFGAIPTSSITGRAAVIYWPINHINALN